ncbi:recombinase family protein [Jiella pacifica]|uniref:Recombinase family protein n=1 Tax=Jiella pacifica TaxID=2696469 RepID=A0A6N9T8A9_9HYPH|nr:recombinase family protein [Jiella pacifica]NDW06475.1 recombinase family protein [Jiella pacifica]
MTKDQRLQSVIYCRVSSKGQKDEGHGLESQETRCRQYAALKGYDVVAVFPDTISGGGDFMKRPGMKALLAFLDAQPNERFVVIFDDLKRFARDTRFHFDLRDAFRQRKATIECLNFKIDDTPEGEFIETILAAQGALERKQNGRQVAQKMRARMENGFWVHMAPVGYAYRTIKGQGKVLVPHEPLAGIVREAFEGYAAGRFQSQGEVKRFFESFPDFPRSKAGHITFQRVGEILGQSLYTGYICSETYGLNWLKGQHEPLISIETFDKVQERRTGISKLPIRKDIGDDFVLRGFVVCGDCGVPFRSSWSKGRTRHYPYYLCQTKGCSSYGKSVARDKLEGEVGQIVRTLQPSEKMFELATRMFRDTWAQRAAMAVDMVKSGKEQLRGIEKRIEGLLGRVVDATNPTVIRTYEDKISELERDKLRLREQVASFVPEDGRLENLLELSLRFLSNPWKLWESGNITLQRTVLRLAFADRLEYDRNTGPRTPKTTLPFKVLEGFCTPLLGNGADDGT